MVVNNRYKQITITLCVAILTLGNILIWRFNWLDRAEETIFWFVFVGVVNPIALIVLGMAVCWCVYRTLKFWLKGLGNNAVDEKTHMAPDSQTQVYKKANDLFMN